MIATDLNLVVLRVADIEMSARFYSVLGIRFEKEQHGKGPVHLSGLIGSVLLELYRRDLLLEVGDAVRRQRDRDSVRTIQALPDSGRRCSPCAPCGSGAYERSDYDPGC